MADILTSGEYSISSLTGRQSRVGRHPVEDKSLNPKKIVSLPQEFQEFGKWTIEAVNGGQYILKSRGAPTSVINHLVFGILTDSPPPQEWLIKAQPQHGKNVYTIEKQYSGEGWVLPESDDQDVQVACRPLIVAPSIPPRYPQNELWLILPIVE